ncbi:hypothetical protein [Acinetobacter phage vB_AbaS_TCUP2199]|nr:hypothetical protein [Acinetobacter phage vB_AbaS_TCUP2199]
MRCQQKLINYTGNKIMSETIRDQALRAALAVLDAEKQIAFVTFRYSVPKNFTEKPQVYRAKVTADQVVQILNQQKVIQEYKEQLKTQPVGKSIDNLLNQSSITYLGEEPEGPKVCPAFIFGTLIGDNNIPSVVEILSIFGYEQLAGIEVPLENLKYLHSILPLHTENDADKKEAEVVNVISKKLKEQFGTSYARSLLGDDGYADVIKTLNPPVDKD